MTYRLCDFYGAYIKPLVNVVNLHTERQTDRQRQKERQTETKREREIVLLVFHKQYNKIVVKCYTDLFIIVIYTKDNI